jgi:hypothetical protein
MSSLTQKLGPGWERINENDYFNEGKTVELLKEVMMIASHHYEKAYI